MNFDLNIYALITDVLPTFLRGAKQLDWLRSLCKPIIDLHTNTFRTFVSDTDERLKWNGQTIYLQQLLVNRYGSGIQIINQNLDARPFYVFGSADNRNPQVFETGDKRNPQANVVNHFDPLAVDFIIQIPAALPFEDHDYDEMAALVKEYKLYSKRFKIIKLT